MNRQLQNSLVGDRYQSAAMKSNRWRQQQIELFEFNLVAVLKWSIVSATLDCVTLYSFSKIKYIRWNVIDHGGTHQ